METHALSEFVIEGETYFLDQRFSTTEVKVVLIAAVDMACFTGTALLKDLRIEGFKKTEYVELLRRALRIQDSNERAFKYGLSRYDGGATFEVRVRMGGLDGGDIFLNGAVFVLAGVEGNDEVARCLRRQAIASSAAAHTASRLAATELELSKTKSICDEAIQTKLADEERTLSTACALLNEKKIKLKELLSQLQQSHESLKASRKESEEKSAEISRLQTALSDAKQEIITKDTKLAKCEKDGIKLGGKQDGGGGGGGGTALRPVDSTLDSYPDFTTIAQRPAVMKLAGVSGSHLSQRSATHHSLSPQRKKRRIEGSKDVITAQDLLDSD